jgi:predicted methyltransferase
MRTLMTTSMAALLLASCSPAADEDVAANEAAIDASAEDMGTPITEAAVEMADQAADSDAVARAIADASRPEEDRTLDEFRLPGEVINFAGVTTGWRVADIVPGGGYYSRVLSTTVGETGHVVAFNPDWVAEAYSETNTRQIELADSRANMSHMINSLDAFNAEMDAPLDAVFMVLFYHDTLNSTPTRPETDRAAMNRQIFDSLRPGGVYLVIDHSAVDGSGGAATDTFHRIDSALVIEEITAAGFVLDGQSDMLANAEDTREVGVFDSSIRRRTDRFVLRFRKPE